ncbi:WXG100 family type VII secretion target [Natronoglycomyces albus]|uniref:Uncharacterized protein n=1 Tax=Natronoglycomyces albus TaxID=2811108 RepID=A0A895XNG8_9ACTN|nr:WXG100 family type VII secretion target [Natronoglycomyces albus]QSB04929.1 hypothetical protein JQS30_14360 [Natronoglycomyces albus]
MSSPQGSGKGYEHYRKLPHEKLFASIMSADPDAVETIADGWKVSAEVLAQAESDMSMALDRLMGQWKGAAASEFQRRVGLLREYMAATQAEMRHTDDTLKYIASTARWAKEEAANKADPNDNLDPSEYLREFGNDPFGTARELLESHNKPRHDRLAQIVAKAADDYQYWMDGEKPPRVPSQEMPGAPSYPGAGQSPAAEDIVGGPYLVDSVPPAIADRFENPPTPGVTPVYPDGGPYPGSPPDRIGNWLPVDDRGIWGGPEPASPPPGIGFDNPTPPVSQQPPRPDQGIIGGPAPGASSPGFGTNPVSPGPSSPSPQPSPGWPTPGPAAPSGDAAAPPPTESPNWSFPSPSEDPRDRPRYSDGLASGTPGTGAALPGSGPSGATTAPAPGTTASGASSAFGGSSRMGGSSSSSGSSPNAAGRSSVPGSAFGSSGTSSGNSGTGTAGGSRGTSGLSSNAGSGGSTGARGTGGGMMPMMAGAGTQGGSAGGAKKGRGGKAKSTSTDTKTPKSVEASKKADGLTNAKGNPSGKGSSSLSLLNHGGSKQKSEEKKADKARGAAAAQVPDIRPDDGMNSGVDLMETEFNWMEFDPDVGPDSNDPKDVLIWEMKYDLWLEEQKQADIDQRWSQKQWRDR